MNGQPLSPIGGGLNEGRSPGEQLQGTYREGENVRGIDARTGRVVWGAQRSGLTRVGGQIVSGSYPTHFASISRQIAARELVSLDTSEAIADTVPSLVGIPWRKNPGDRVLDVDTGIDGQGYYLLRSGVVVVYNRKGREVERLPTGAPVGFEAVPRVIAGEDGAVYVAWTRDEPLTDPESGEVGAGRMTRWVRQEDRSWTRAWTSVIEERIATFGFRNGVLWVGEDPTRESEVGGRLPAAITRLSNPLLDGRIALRQTAVPRPIYDIAVMESGSALVSSPSNPARAGADGVFFTQRSVDWTPPQLPSWSVSGWAWLDAFTVNQESVVPEDGDRVEVMRDKRLEPNDFNEIFEDDPPRELLSTGSRGIFSDPVFSQEAFGGFGGLRFNGDSALVSRPHTDPDDRLLQRALIPAVELGTTDSWMAFAVVEFDEDQESIGVFQNILTQLAFGADNPSWTMRVQGDVGTPVLNVFFGDGSTTDPGSSGPLVTVAPARTAIICLEHTGFEMNLYVNGRLLAGSSQATPLFGDKFQITNSTVDYPGPVTVVGAGRPNRVNLLQEPGLVATGNAGQYSGELPRLWDADLTLPGNYRISAQDAIFTFTFPSGSPIEVDSFGVDFKYLSAAPIEVLFEMGDDAVTILQSFTSTVTRSPGDGTYRQDFRIPDAIQGPYEFYRLTFTSQGQQSSIWEFAELWFYDQNTKAESASAQFNLGEMLFLSARPEEERLLIEGYLAHKWGLSHTLLSRDEFGPLHPLRNPGEPPEGQGSFSGASRVAGRLTSVDPLLVKYTADGSPVDAYTGAGVGLGAVSQGDKIMAIGEPEPVVDPVATGTILSKFTDLGLELRRDAGLSAGGSSVSVQPIKLDVGPCLSTFAAVRVPGGGTSIKRWNGLTMEEDWSLLTVSSLAASSVSVAGNQYDATLLGGDCGPEFLFASGPFLDAAFRVDVLGLRDNGVDAGRDVSILTVSSNGDVHRCVNDEWTLVEPGALPGRRVGSATLYGRTILADGTGYRVYDHQLNTLRDFEEAVRGEFPPRCELIAAYRGRLTLARGDNAFTIYQSRYGDPFDFDYGEEVQTISQAIAGTTASQGTTPEPITALMPFRDDLMFIGTTESLFVLTGDLADGGRLDQVDRSQGVAYGYAWCESPQGIYYFTGRGGVMFISPSQGLRLVSDARIQRRLEEIDLTGVRVELEYNWLDQTVHVFILPRALGSDVQHFAYEERTQAWHVDTFGNGLRGAVTTAATLIGDTPEERSLILGFADGYARRLDQYAVDDDGQPVKSRVLVGPMAGSAAGVEVKLSGVHGELATDQGPVEVGARAANTADNPGPVGGFERIEPGRGYGAGFNVSAPAVYIEVRGLGKAWAIHGLRAELSNMGSARTLL